MIQIIMATMTAFLSLQDMSEKGPPLGGWISEREKDPPHVHT